ncbi:hypothetical protein [Actinoplanes subglobosus]|uniref:Uncharacterized protein n=1 Tax=Actinoplanes subglobosus TaxID=1547892 RepID=A0ABV8J6M2_9ACTN
MRTLWDREMSAEVALLGDISPARRIKLVSDVIDDTVASLPDAGQDLLTGEAGAAVEAAIRAIHAAVGGSSEDEPADELFDELLELAEDVDVMPLWQLFMGLSYCVAVVPMKIGVGTTEEVLSALYDTVRDCQDLPEFPVGTAEDVVLAVESANDRCVASIARQKTLIREAADQG